LTVSTVLVLFGTLFSLARVFILPRISLPWSAIGASGAIFLVCAILFRPPHSAPATNVVYDAVVVGLRMLHFIGKGAVTGRWRNAGVDHSLEEFEGRPIFDIGRKFRHIFIIFLESADKLAWPFQERFCRERNCPGVDPQFLTAESRTPFFNNLTRTSLLVDNFRTNVAFTIKVSREFLTRNDALVY
jgi:hypothetical protein